MASACRPGLICPSPTGQAPRSRSELVHLRFPVIGQAPEKISKESALYG
jgi:hypothetical protein